MTYQIGQELTAAEVRALPLGACVTLRGQNKSGFPSVTDCEVSENRRGEKVLLWRDMDTRRWRELPIRHYANKHYTLKWLPAVNRGKELMNMAMARTPEPPAITVEGRLNVRLAFELLGRLLGEQYGAEVHLIGLRRKDTPGADAGRLPQAAGGAL